MNGEGWQKRLRDITMENSVEGKEWEWWNDCTTTEIDRVRNLRRKWLQYHKNIKSMMKRLFLKYLKKPQVKLASYQIMIWK